MNVIECDNDPAHDRNSMPVPTRGALLALLAVAAIIRLLYFSEHQSSPFFATPVLDELYYDGMAQALLGVGNLRLYGGFRPMLYPLLLAAPYGLAGVGAGRAVAILLQHAMGLATILVVVFAGTRMTRNARSGLAAGWLYALAGPPLYFEGELLIATLMAFLCAATLLSLFRAVDAQGAQSLRRWILTGMLAGLAVQARPNMLLFFAAFPLLSLWRFGRRAPQPFHPVAALGGAVLILLVFAPLNFLQSGRFQIVTGAGGINFYLGNNRMADGMIPRQATGVRIDADYLDSVQVFAKQEYVRRMQKEGMAPKDDPRAISSYWRAETWRDIRTHPRQWLALMARKVRLMLWNHEIPNNKSYSFALAHESAWLRWMPVSWFVLVALAPLGLWSAWRRRQHEAVPATLLFLFFYGAGVVLFFVNGRFRLPLWPVMAMAGGGGLLFFVDAAKERCWTRFSVGGIAALLLGAFSWYPVSAVPPDDHARDYFFRANARLERGDTAGAVADARTSLELDDRNADAWLTLGNALFANGHTAEANSVYARYVVLEPEEPRGWNNLGAVREALGHWTEAYKAYCRALELHPGHRSALLNAAILELRAGRADLAAPRLALFSRASSPTLHALCATSFLMSLQGDTERAAVLLAHARSINAELADQLMKELSEPIRLGDNP